MSKAFFISYVTTYHLENRQSNFESGQFNPPKL
jgi:hypothetical protein